MHSESDDIGEDHSLSPVLANSSRFKLKRRKRIASRKLDFKVNATTNSYENREGEQPKILNELARKCSYDSLATDSSNCITERKIRQATNTDSLNKHDFMTDFFQKFEVCDLKSCESTAIEKVVAGSPVFVEHEPERLSLKQIVENRCLGVDQQSHNNFRGFDPHEDRSISTRRLKYINWYKDFIRWMHIPGTSPFYRDYQNDNSITWNRVSIQMNGTWPCLVQRKTPNEHPVSKMGVIGNNSAAKTLRTEAVFMKDINNVYHLTSTVNIPSNINVSLNSIPSDKNQPSLISNDLGRSSDCVDTKKNSLNEKCLTKTLIGNTNSKRNDDFLNNSVRTSISSLPLSRPPSMGGFNTGRGQGVTVQSEKARQMQQRLLSSIALDSSKISEPNVSVKKLLEVDCTRNNRDNALLETVKITPVTVDSTLPLGTNISGFPVRTKESSENGSTAFQTGRGKGVWAVSEKARKMQQSLIADIVNESTTVFKPPNQIVLNDNLNDHSSCNELNKANESPFKIPTTSKHSAACLPETYKYETENIDKSSTVSETAAYEELPVSSISKTTTDTSGKSMMNSHKSKVLNSFSELKSSNCMEVEDNHSPKGELIDLNATLKATVHTAKNQASSTVFTSPWRGSQSELEKSMAAFSPIHGPALPAVRGGSFRTFNSTPIKYSIIEVEPIKVKQIKGEWRIPKPLEGPEQFDQQVERLMCQIAVLQERREITLQLQHSTQQREQRFGYLYTQKMRNKTSKISLHLIPRTDADCLRIALKQAINYHFLVNETTVRTVDGAMIVPNSENLVGVNELDAAFQRLGTINPSIIPHGWFHNHYRLVIWKLLWYDNHFSQFQPTLTVENVMQQLKYRYDREIQNNERSALHSVSQHTGNVKRRLVLRVTDITGYDLEYNLLLTDGWYEICAIPDEGLCYQIKTGRLSVGMKIVTYNGDLNHPEPCHPLQLQGKLKLFSNITRRARWWTKLGFQKNPEAFPITLQSILPNGGQVGCICVYIARVYPIQYMERCGDKTEWRSEKADALRQVEWERVMQIQLEQLWDECRKEIDDNLKEQNNNTNFNNIKDVSNITCPQLLYCLCHFGGRNNDVESKLTEQQWKSVKLFEDQLSVQHQQQYERQREILMRRQRDVVGMVRLKVLDTYNENDLNGYTISVWNPHLLPTDMTNEGTFCKVFHLQPKSYGDLATTKSTTVSVGNRSIKKTLAAKYEKYKRAALPIALVNQITEHPFDEFDTFGLVVQSATVKEGTGSYVWLTDVNARLLCIDLPKRHGQWEQFETVKRGQIIAIMNLRRKQNQDRDFSQAGANVHTVVSLKPKRAHLKLAVNAFSQLLPKDPNQLLQECDIKIEQFQDRLGLSESAVGRLLDATTCDSNLLNMSQLTTTDMAMSLIDLDNLA